MRQGMPFLIHAFRTLLLIVFLSSSPAMAQVTWRTEVFLRSDELAHIPPALEHAILSFVGDGGSSVAEEIPSDFLTRPRSTPSSSGSSSRVAYTQSRSRRFGGRLVATTPITGTFDFVGSAMLAYGQSDFRLPNGAGVLTEGIDIRFRTISTELDAVVSYHAKMFGTVPVTVAAGGGVLHAYTRTSVDSPILLIKESNRDTIPFAALKLGMRLPETMSADVGVVLEIRNYAEFGPSAALEINFRF